MQKRIPILINAIALAISVSAQVGATDLNRPTGDHEREQEQEQEKRQKYTCPMHPEVVMDHPGNCPKCGMTLIPKKEDTKAKPKSNARASYDMHQHHDDEAMPRESHHMHAMQGTNRTTCRTCRCRCNRRWILPIR